MHFSLPILLLTPFFSSLSLPQTQTQPTVPTTLVNDVTRDLTLPQPIIPTTLVRQVTRSLLLAINELEGLLGLFANAETDIIPEETTALFNGLAKLLAEVQVGV
jgi:hypothetical protein